MMTGDLKIGLFQGAGSGPECHWTLGDQKHQQRRTVLRRDQGDQCHRQVIENLAKQLDKARPGKAHVSKNTTQRRTKMVCPILEVSIPNARALSWYGSKQCLQAS